MVELLPRDIRLHNERRHALSGTVNGNIYVGVSGYRPEPAPLLVELCVAALVLDGYRYGVTRAGVPRNVLEGALHEVCTIGSACRQPAGDEAVNKLTATQQRDFLPGRIAYPKFDGLDRVVARYPRDEEFLTSHYRPIARSRDGRAR